MIVKRGVLCLEGLDDDRNWLGLPKRFALSLYGDIIEDRPDLDAWLPRILERHQTSLGAFKRTADRRFMELDAVIEGEVAGMRQAWSGPFRIHDLAVSDGRSSVELLDRLQQHGPLEFVASDRDTRVDLVTPAGRDEFVAFDEESKPVQFGGRGFVLSPIAPEHPLLYPVNRLVAAWLERRLLPQARRALEQATKTPLADFEVREVGEYRVRRIPLLCRALHERIQCGSIRFVRHDLLDPLEGRFHLIRLMNALNHVPADQRGRAIRNLFEGLEEGGLLAIGRTNDPGGETRATVWRRTGERLQEVHELHGGSESAQEILESLPGTAAVR